MNDLKHKYNVQKRHAKQRGIEWLFTFESWLEFWGEDINRRGCGVDLLSCQRIADAGPYAPWNCRKGFPKQNMQTYSKVLANKKTQEAHKRHQSKLDNSALAPCKDDVFDEDEKELEKMLGLRVMHDWTS